MERILLIEDDQALGRGTALALAGEGREIRVAATLAQGRAALGEEEYALVLLDLNLPDGNGLDFLPALRRTSGVPVLILTANDLESDQVAGLELGADDYVTKPFSLAVLRARVNRLLRRGSAPAAALELGPFSFDFERLRFMRNGTEVELSKTEQRLLHLLVEHRGQTLTREQLLDRVWDGGEFVDANALSVAVKRLRDKLTDAPIKTVYGLGYTWEAVCGALALAALGAGFGLAQWLYTRRLLARLDRMLADAVDGSFRESRFDESRLSALEGRLARFLNGSAASARELEGKRAAIQTLISDISHQTKTPIANILLYASLLAEGELSPEQAAQAATLSRQAEKLSFLIQALVKASRLETGIITTAPEPQPVGPLLEGALAQARPQAEAKGLTLAAEPCGAAARFDRKWTAEALFNVVDNAVKYTPAGGRVTLSAVPLGQFCRVDVSDTGIGIPEEEQGRIFGRFYRGGAVRAEEGVGIGLYLVREILRRQGGYVKVASRPGQGTTFSLYLPRE